MTVTDNERAQRFLRETRLPEVTLQTLPAGSVESVVRQFIIDKYSHSFGIVAAAKSLDMPADTQAVKDMDYWQEALTRINSVASAVKVILGITDDRETVADIENMSMAEFAANRKRLGMKNIMTAMEG